MRFEVERLRVETRNYGDGVAIVSLETDRKERK